MANQLSLTYRQGTQAASLFHRCKMLEMGDNLGSAILDQLESSAAGPVAMPWIPMSAAEATYRGFQAYLCTDIRSPSHTLCTLLLARPTETRFLIDDKLRIFIANG